LTPFFEESTRCSHKQSVIVSQVDIIVQVKIPSRSVWISTAFLRSVETLAGSSLSYLSSTATRIFSALCTIFHRPSSLLPQSIGK